ncbi:hypothetical protein PI95_005465 [Hassallia byssoidea VB512170]|uniref:Uncharacterized protein n=1 Tax=Hassallia byssoidea VB512170 TaxID=1304833 RepID=A0A846H3S6_9CYAN|nr:hypothetical protein [Hassalia byssoidea]NEU72032.1 hypothetical protein [Hassalia byssoidea VB512170]
MGNGEWGMGQWAWGNGHWELKKQLYAGACSNTILSMPNAHCPLPHSRSSTLLQKFYIG